MKLRSALASVCGTRAVGVCALLLCAATTSCGNKSASARPKEAVAVTVAEVVRRDVPFEIRAFGSVEASSTVDVVPQVSGLITQVHFKEGDLVKKGDLLFTVDTRPYRASLAVAQAELARSRAVAEQARTEADRYAKLHEQGVATEQQLVKARADAASSEAAVEVGQAQSRSASLNVTFTHITSPMDGKTGSLLVHAGNVVQSGSAQPLVVIRSLSPVYVRFSVPQEYLGKIRQRLGAERVVVAATPRGTDAKAAQGELTFLENTIDPATGTLALKATFANGGLELWPGGSVDVSLVLDVDRQVLVAPESAIQEGQNGHYAFAIEKGNKAVLRPVKLLRSTAEWSLLESGLQAGEQVVTDGQVRLRNGMAVQIKPSSPRQRAKGPGESGVDEGGG